MKRAPKMEILKQVQDDRKAVARMTEERCSG